MFLRRCHSILLEPRETLELDLAALLAGEPKLQPRLRWIALAAHLDAAIQLDDAQVQLLGSVSSIEPVSRSLLEQRGGVDAVANLVDAGLLLEVGRAAGSTSPVVADDSLRACDWHGLAAVAHRHLRWRGVDAEQVRTSGTLGNDAEMLAWLGTPPPPAMERLPPGAASPLPDHPACEGAGDHRARTTCRNFDVSRNLPLDLFAQMLHTVYGAQGQSVVSGVPVLKKNSPSAGGLHPVEAYLLVQHVEGVAPGLYHYRPDTHALEPLRSLSPDEAREYASLFVARQPWFVDAHVQVILAARFQRNFWKYRNHAKAYRAVILDAGHLSQMQYLAATELGLGAFITAAINEGDIEDAFGLDPMQEGVIAVTGFGWRGERMEVLEFDPLKQVWPDWSPE